MKFEKIWVSREDEDSRELKAIDKLIAAALIMPREVSGVVVPTSNWDDIWRNSRQMFGIWNKTFQIPETSYRFMVNEYGVKVEKYNIQLGYYQIFFNDTVWGRGKFPLTYTVADLMYNGYKNRRSPAMIKKIQDFFYRRYSNYDFWEDGVPEKEARYV